MYLSPLRRFFEGPRTGIRLVFAGALALLAAACGTTIEDAVPGASRTGVYPNLNIPQQAATEQLSNTETRAGIAALTAAEREQQAAASNGAPTSEAERLRRLRESHADAVLREIEN